MRCVKNTNKQTNKHVSGDLHPSHGPVTKQPQPGHVTRPSLHLSKKRPMADGLDGWQSLCQPDVPCPSLDPVFSLMQGCPLPSPPENSLLISGKECVRNAFSSCLIGPSQPSPTSTVRVLSSFLRIPMMRTGEE